MMKNKNINLYKDELEEITGKLYNGDLTPLVYDLLKTSEDLESLLLYLTGEEVAKVEEVVNVPKPAPSFENWFNNFPTAE